MNCQKCGCVLPEGVTCCPSCGTFTQTQSLNQVTSVPQNTLNQQQVQPQPSSLNINQQYNQIQQQHMQQQVINQQPMQQVQPSSLNINQQYNQMSQQPVQQQPPQMMQQGMQQNQMLNQNQPLNGQLTAGNKPLFPGQGIPIKNNQNNQSDNKQTTNAEEPKKKKSFLKILILLIIVAVAGVFLYPKIKSILYKPQLSSVDKMFETTSFWLPNNDGKVAIFNVDGKQLTEFIYTAGSNSFINDTAFVKNEKEEYAIITSLGKELVKFGKYEKITDIGAGYIAKDSSGKNFLYNRAGNLVKELGNNPVTFGMNYGLSGRKVNYLYAGIFDNDNFTIINHAGEELLTFPYVENEHTIEDGSKLSPKTDLYDKYLSIFYNQHNYIINVVTKEKIIDFESPLEFNIAAVNDEKKEIFLKSISKNGAWYRDESEIFEYKLIRNKEIVYTKTIEDEIDEVYYNDGFIQIEALLDQYLLTETGDKILLSEDDSYIMGYTDYNNYIKINKNYNKEVYVDGQLKKELNCGRIITSDTTQNIYAKYGIYVLKECEGYKDEAGYDTTRDMIIKPDGTPLNDNGYYYVSKFNENGILTVSEDGKTAYLMDPTGKKLSDNYYFSEYDAEWENRISQLYFGDNEFFVARKDEYNEVIFDKNGKEYITAKNIHEVVNELLKDVFVILEYDDYYTVYNVTKQKEILKSKEDPDCNNGYIMISQDGKMEFYSYITGKLFYTIEKK